MKHRIKLNLSLVVTISLLSACCLTPSSPSCYVMGGQIDALAYDCTQNPYHTSGYCVFVDKNNNMIGGTCGMSISTDANGVINYNKPYGEAECKADHGNWHTI